jgi:two-component sensor histidine kinase
MGWTISTTARDRMTDATPPPAASPGADQSADQTAELLRALEQKTALVNEIDHRVKNNLQLIASLLMLQARRTSDPAATEALRGIIERVNAVAAVHRRLFQADDVQRFDLAEFIRDLVGDMVSATGRSDIVAHLDLGAVAVNAPRAAPLALVVNEMVSNALRHAFPSGHGGDIFVTVKRDDSRIWIEVADTGVGWSSEVAGGFGSTVIQLLCRQLKASYSKQDASPGVRVTLALPAHG